MKSDQELRQKFNLSVLEKNIINLSFIEEELFPEDSVRLAELVADAIHKIFNADTKKNYKGLVDMTALKEKVSFLDASIRKLYALIMSNKQINEVAIVGSNTFYQAAISLIVQSAQKNKEVKWFSDRKEALDWLQEQR